MRSAFLSTVQPIIWSVEIWSTVRENVDCGYLWFKTWCNRNMNSLKQLRIYLDDGQNGCLCYPLAIPVKAGEASETSKLLTPLCSIKMPGHIVLLACNFYLWSGRRWGSHTEAICPRARWGWHPPGRWPQWCTQTCTASPGSGSLALTWTSSSCSRSPPWSVALGAEQGRGEQRFNDPSEEARETMKNRLHILTADRDCSCVSSS